jgi:hypothetical protein
MADQGPRTQRTLADGLEAAFILVAFRRFAQSKDNQLQRTQSGDEGSGYYHD